MFTLYYTRKSSKSTNIVRNKSFPKSNEGGNSLSITGESFYANEPNSLTQYLNFSDVCSFIVILI